MTPQFKGLGAELSGLKSAIRQYTRDIRKDMVEIAEGLPQEMAEAKQHVGDAKQGFLDIKAFNAEMRSAATNGDDPTTGSESSSEPQKPAASVADSKSSFG